MRLVEINAVAGWGSTGRIAEQIGLKAVESGYTVGIAYGREPAHSSLPSYRIGTNHDITLHGIATRLLDRHGLESRKATQGLIDWLRHEMKPDIVHLHNLHGYYINYPMLFEWLRKWGGPVVWTLHDCWTMTGHCAYFDFRGCERWTTVCHKCPGVKDYPQSFFDGSRRNFKTKEKAWAGMQRLTLVPVSDWLAGIVGRSPLMAGHRVEVIKNGIDLTAFHPSEERKDGDYVIGVASVWDKRKGLEDFFKLRKMLSPEVEIRLVGLTSKQIKSLPTGMEGIERTADVTELARLYSGAVALVNPTWEDTYPTVNLEAMACGTPVVTYGTGGSPESLTDRTGVVVDKGNIAGLVAGIEACRNMKSEDCRKHAEAIADKEKAFDQYINLFDSL